MRGAVLTGKGNYLLLGSHTLKIEKFFFKQPGQNTPLGLFIAEFKCLESSNPEMRQDIVYSEGFDPAKSGWLERMKKFLLAGLGVDWRGAVTDTQHDLVADIRFSAEFASEREALTKKYKVAPEEYLVGRKIVAQGSPYTTKKLVTIVSTQFSPARDAA